MGSSEAIFPQSLSKSNLKMGLKMVSSGCYFFILIVSLDFSWKYEKSNESMYNEMPIYDHNYDNHDYTCRDPAAG